MLVVSVEYITTVHNTLIHKTISSFISCSASTIRSRLFRGSIRSSVGKYCWSKPRLLVHFFELSIRKEFKCVKSDYDGNCVNGVHEKTTINP